MEQKYVAGFNMNDDVNDKREKIIKLSTTEIQEPTHS